MDEEEHLYDSCYEWIKGKIPSLDISKYRNGKKEKVEI